MYYEKNFDSGEEVCRAKIQLCTVNVKKKTGHTDLAHQEGGEGMKTSAFMAVILFALTIGLSGMNRIYAEEEIAYNEQMDEDVINPEEDMKDEEAWDEEREALLPDEDKEIDESESLEDEEIDESRRYFDVDDVERL